MSTTNESKPKACSPRELAQLYGVSVKTLRTWLEPHQQAVGPRRSKYYNARQLQIIFQCIGEP